MWHLRNIWYCNKTVSEVVGRGESNLCFLKRLNKICSFMDNTMMIIAILNMLHLLSLIPFM